MSLVFLKPILGSMKQYHDDGKQVGFQRQCNDKDSEKIKFSL